MTGAPARWPHPWLANLFSRRAVPAIVGLLFGIPLLFVGTKLFSARVSGFVEADLLTVEARDGFATADLAAHNLRVFGLATIVLSNGTRLAGRGLSVRIDDLTAEALTSVPGFQIPAHSWFSVEVDRNEQRLDLVARSAQLQLDLIPQRGARVSIDGPDCCDGQCDFTIDDARPLRLTATANEPLKVSMDLYARARTVADRIAAAEMRFWKPEQFAGKVEKRSSLTGGSLRFRELPDQVVSLERGTILDFEAGDLVVRAIEVRGDSVYAQFSGQVEDVWVEIGDTAYSLMPNWFDRWSRSPYVKLGLGVVTILLGGGLTLIQSIAKRR